MRKKTSNNTVNFNLKKRTITGIMITIMLVAGSFLAFYFPTAAVPPVLAQLTDTTPPTGTVTINSGSTITTNRTVTLTLTCDDGSGTGCSQMKISVDGTFDTESFETFATSKPLTLPAGDGIKLVRVIFRDVAGNTATTAASDDIVLDTIAPPAPVIVSPSNGALTTNNIPTISGTVAANLLFKFGSFGTGDGQFVAPHSIATDSAGNVYVTDFVKNMVQKFTSTGTFITKWGSSGNGDGQFNGTAGIAVDSAGNVYVSDLLNHRIQKFSSAGAFIAKWGSSGSADGQLYFPIDIAVDSAGNVYVADSGNNRIQKFSQTGTFLAKWGSFGSADGQFKGSREVAVDSAGNVYVADSGNNRIQKFSQTGTFLAKWGSFGSADGQFDMPFGLAIDPLDNVFVSDGNNYRIQKFSQTGTFLAKWGSFGTTEGLFDQPRGLHIDSTGNIYVVDTGNHRIQKFEANTGNSVIQILDGPTTVLVTLTLPPSGVWSFTPPVALSNGVHVITAKVTDAAGLQSLPSAAVGLAIYSIVNLSDSAAAPSLFPNIAVSGNNVYVVWEEQIAGNKEIFYRRSTDGGNTFGSPINISSNTGNSSLPYVAVDASGNNAHVVWQQDMTNGDSEIFYARSTDGGNTFGSPINISNSNDASFNPHIAVSGSNVHVVWSDITPPDGKFSFPDGTAVDSFGNVYVTDAANDRVQKFDSSGNFITKWGSSGTGDGQFDYPEGIAVDDSSGNVYVVDSNNNRIQKFTSTGTFVTKWGSLGSEPGRFNDPQAIAVDSSGNVYVTDSGNSRIQKFDSSGNFITQWGSAGTGGGQFGIIMGGIAVDSFGNVYVTDFANARVQKFDSTGGFLTMWGSSGSEDGQFSGPEGIAVDSASNVYVVDSGNSRIQKFDSSGNFITQWGSAGTGGGQFSGPHGITIDSSNNVYIADSGNDRIQKFTSSGAFITKWGSLYSGTFYIFYARSVDSGASFSRPVTVNDASGDSRVPYVAVDGGGNNVYVVWEENPVTSAFDILLAKSSDGGTSFTSPANISNNAGDSFSPHIVVSGSNVHIIWEDNTSLSNFDVFYAKSSDGGTSFTSPANISNNAGDSFVPYLAESAGKLFAVWEDNTSMPAKDIFLKKSRDAGDTFDSVFNLSSNTGTSGFPESSISGNDLFAVWHDDTQGNNEILFAKLANLVNNAPFANSQTVLTNEDSAPITITLTGSDMDSDPLSSFSVVIPPAKGSLGSITQTGLTSATVIYTPGANQNGADIFTFKVNDGIADSPSPATVLITINAINDPPVANAGPDQTVDEGSLVTLNGAGSSDIDGDTLTFFWTQIAGPAVMLSNPNVANPTFTAPAILSNTVLQFQLTLSDGTATSPPDTVNVTIVDKKGTLTIKKVVQGTTDPPLAGAVFKITPHPRTLSGSLTIQDGDALDASPTNGIIQINDAEFGTYSIEEIQVPAGHVRIVQSVTVSIHATQHSPTILIENKPEVVPVTQPILIPAPDLSSIEFNSFVTNGASVGGVTVNDVNDLPSALLATSVSQVVASPPAAITFSTAAAPTSTTDQLISSFNIPKYPALEPSLAQNNVYAVPPVTISQQGSANKFLMTPVIEKTISGMTLVLDQTTPVASGAAKVKQIEMKFSNSGAVSNVAFSFSITDTVPPNTPPPPANLVETAALFLSVGFVGTAAFSDAAAFQAPPKIRTLVSKTLDIAKLPDGCPDVTLLLFNEATGQWQALRKPARELTLDTAQDCGYTVEPEHFSKFAVGGVKISAQAVTGVLSGGGIGGDGAGGGAAGSAVMLSSLSPGSNIRISIPVSSEEKAAVEIAFEKVTSGGTLQVVQMQPKQLERLFTKLAGDKAIIEVRGTKSNTPDSSFTQYATVGTIFDINTSAITFSGQVEVTIPYDPSLIPSQAADESDVRFLHYDGKQWKDATASVDTFANTVSGRILGSLSPVLPAVINDGTFNTAYFATNPLAKFSIMNFTILSTVVDSNNNNNSSKKDHSGSMNPSTAGATIARVASVGEQLTLSAEIKNMQKVNQSYALIIQVLDEEDFTYSLSWHAGVAKRAEIVDVSVSWAADKGGLYQIKIFVWDTVGGDSTDISDAADNPPVALSTVAATRMRVV